ncbi:MAG: tetratricopeptide repeat protein [Magnetococcales bacterium]|nr:tetratricopeptide repeat protein [Magnetococcales bacterium]
MTASPERKPGLTRGSSTLVDELGYLFYSSLQVLKKISSSAIQTYRSLFSVDSDLRLQYFLDKGIRYTERGRYAQAIVVLERVLLERPHDLETLFHLGFCLLREERVEEGIALLIRAEQMDGSDARISSVLGMAYIQAEKYAEAVTMLERALTGNPDNFNLHYRLGLAYDKMANYEKALESFQTAGKLRPREPKVYQSIGFILEQLGKREEAVDYFKRAMQLAEGRS